jgi:hypothetical protein
VNEISPEKGAETDHLPGLEEPNHIIKPTTTGGETSDMSVGAAIQKANKK